MSNPTPLRISSSRNNQTFCTKESEETANFSCGSAENHSEVRQQRADFIIVTAKWLLNGTEPGGIIFPMSYWSLVPDNFGLDTHVLLLSADLREGDMLWRFPEGLSLYSTCPQQGPDCRQDETHWAELSSGNRGGVQAKTNPHTAWEGHSPWTNSTGIEVYQSDNDYFCSAFQYKTCSCCCQRCTEWCLSSSEGRPCEHTPSPGSGGTAACLITP